MRTVETENESCLSCKFWAGVRPQQAPDNSVSVTGQCRKNAPTLVDGKAVWPATEPHDWCAEYQVGTTPNEARRFL